MKEKRKFPPAVQERLRALISEMEKQETKDRPAGGTFELKISEDEALWFVAYKTHAE